MVPGHASPTATRFKGVRRQGQTTTRLVDLGDAIQWLPYEIRSREYDCRSTMLSANTEYIATTCFETFMRCDASRQFLWLAPAGIHGWSVRRHGDVQVPRCSMFVVCAYTLKLMYQLHAGVKYMRKQEKKLTCSL